jgi:hypothetical protein
MTGSKQYWYIVTFEAYSETMEKEKQKFKISWTKAPSNKSSAPIQEPDIIICSLRQLDY